MGHPVTTNPFIIMLINMTVVFIVLVSLSFLIQLIHKLDPTKAPEKPTPSNEFEEMRRIAQNAAKNSPAPEPAAEEGISPEIIAAISAAIAACGTSGTVRAVKILDNENSMWKKSSRVLVNK